MKYILILTSSILFYQEKNNNYSLVPFEKGLPEQIPFKLEHTLYSSISSGEYYKALFVVSRDSLKTAEKCFLFVVNENGFSFNAISFEKTEDNNYKATISLSSQEEDKISPLSLLLNVEEKNLQYRWVNENRNSLNNPTIVEEYQLIIRGEYEK